MSSDEMSERARKRQKGNDSFNNYRNEYLLTCKWRGLVDAKLSGSAPYHFFLTGVKELPKSLDEDLTITFPGKCNPFCVVSLPPHLELLDKSLGTLEHSLHVNFMIELPWLLAQYALSDIVNPSMTILYGVDDDDLRHPPKHLKLTAIQVKSPYPFGHHHTKLSIFFYTDKSVRFVVSTANLLESDWEERTQGVWISPKCPYLGDDVPINYGESESFFKADILQYLNSYRLPQIRDWLVRIQKTDCSEIKVCFVSSIPGDHGESYGYLKLSKLIKEYAAESIAHPGNLVVQCSSIGSLGQSPESWLTGEFGRSLSKCSQDSSESQVRVIYPSVENVTSSLHGLYGGACLPYSSGTHKRQLWLEKYLWQWRSDSRYRSKAVPHIKTYGKMSPDGKEIFWFLLTSANLSKAAWGKQNKTGGINIMSYEAGVLYLPKLMIGKDVFTIKHGGYRKPNEEGFPLPYDSPLKLYESKDEIFLHDRHFPR
ncbi:hypothetical protein RUM44_008680 [Polyplax serrata]|uniref:Tyrosyl-DNA phosphodiesterase n=1 Tax=Polyplax serrata TaxID=468196 RepID=A0ABR1B902_POLSC